MKIKIHFITQIFLLVCLVSGYFYEVMTMYFCLLFHEIGHYIMIKILKKDITMLEISPLGGILHIDKCQNDFNYKEFLIHFSGPVVSFILYIILNCLDANEILLQSSLYILILNLLPIYPLDGGKILLSLRQYFMPYRKALRFTIFSSLIAILLLIVYLVNYYNYVLILLYFFYLNLKFYYDISYIYYSFLWYKYLHPNKRLKQKLILNDKTIYYAFYKGFNNLFYQDLHFIEEKQILKQTLTLHK
jgi:stage IV sporulation protein FB